jgi:hypothetical protein
MFSIQQYIEQERHNPDLQSTLDVESILRASENVDMDYLGNKTLDTFSKEIVQVLRENELNPPEIQETCGKLVEYRLIEEIYQLHKGKHVRWLRNGRLTNGGIVVDVKFLDNGTHILCKNKQRFIQYKYDECITFQRFSEDEMIILQLISYASAS